VRINDEYEIGNDPQRGGTYTVYRVTTARGSRGQSQQLTEAEVKGVLEYASDGRHILLRTRDEFVWRPTGDEGDWRSGAAAPHELAELRNLLAAPRPSRRAHFVLLGGAFALGGMIVVEVAKRRRGGRHS